MHCLRVAAVALVLSVFSLAEVRAADYYVTPMCVDPPIVVDGNLSDWTRVPNPILINRREQVTDSIAAWNGPQDLSGVVHLAWREMGLFIAAEVTDDKIVQTMTGGEMWKGDHVSILMDLTPGVEPERTGFGAGQFQIGLSPGSLGAPVGDKPLPPEIYVWTPSDAPAEGGQIVARRTERGYVIEAFVPWSRLKVAGVAMGKEANFEAALSDTDVLPAEQQKWMTYGDKPWQRSRERLLPMVFGDGNGQAPAPVRSISIAPSAKVAPGKTLALKFTAPEAPAGKDPFIFFSARFHRDKVAGYSARSLAAELNGRRITGDRINNRPQSSMTMSGKEGTFIGPDGSMTLPYAPSGEAYDKHPTYSLLDNVKACEFEFNVGGLVKTGENTLTFQNLVEPGTPGDYDATIEKIEFRLKAHVDKTDPRKPAPTGELPVCEPQTAFPKTYSGMKQQEGAQLTFTVNGEPFAVASSFTAPDGKRYTGSSSFYKHSREVVEHDEWIEVRDTFTNLTDDNVPVMQKHSCAVGPQRAKGVWISGLRMPSGTGRMSIPENPTVFVATEKSGAGLLPLNDVFRVHSDQGAGDGAIEISDLHFVLKAGGAYTAEWAIVPVVKPDVWAFINAARRLADVNFTMKILSADLEYRGAVRQWTDEQYRQFFDRKSANASCDGLYCANWNGRLPQGIAFQELVKDPKNAQYYTDAHERIRKAFPDDRLKFAIYYHCYLDVMDENVEKYKDARRLDVNGKQMVYSLDYYRLYVPTLENEFGKEIAKGIDVRLDQLGANAFYWDEYNASRGDYTYIPGMWDGCSGDIDSRTFKLIRQKTSVHLICLPFLEYHIKRIVERVPSFFNGAPYSRTLARLRFQAFTETGSISNCHRMLLYTPVALGDHLTEHKQQDCYGVMLKALNWACLYAWYPSAVFPTHKTLTEHMFPSTPIELHEGYLIARERIVTNRSGLFGWADASDFTVYVYDREGKLTEGKEAKPVTRDGKNYAEVRIPEGYSAAIVRAGN
jgi:hypothetical protein